MRTPPFADSRGLSLAEILVAVFLIAVGLVGLAAVIPVATYGVQEGNQLSKATFLADQRLEQVRNVLWTAIPDTDCLGTGPSSAPTIPSGKSCSTTSASAGATTFDDDTPVTGYSRTVRIQNCGTTACGSVNHAALRLVTVTVTYTPMNATGGATAGASSKSVTINMLIAQR